MTNVHSILRSLIIYVVCIPLAVFLGYSLSDPLNRGSFKYGLKFFFSKCFPFFRIPGRPIIGGLEFVFGVFCAKPVPWANVLTNVTTKGPTFGFTFK